MNLPNKLTMMRMIIIPIIVIIYLLQDYIQDATLPIIAVLFVGASVTDFFDGHLARKFDMVTTFGKFMDPLADKLLVLGTLIVLSDHYAIHYVGTISMWMPFWVIFIILARELIVTSIRLVAIGEGVVLVASKLGKYKAAFTMVTITYYLFVMPVNSEVINIIGICMVLISVLLTVWSGFDYLIKNRKFITKSI